MEGCPLLLLLYLNKRTAPIYIYIYIYIQYQICLHEIPHETILLSYSIAPPTPERPPRDKDQSPLGDLLALHGWIFRRTRQVQAVSSLLVIQGSISPPDLPFSLWGNVEVLPKHILKFFASFNQLVTFSVSAVAYG